MTWWHDNDTPTRHAAVARLWATGMTTQAIGDELGTTKNAVIGAARRAKVTPRPSPIKPKPLVARARARVEPLPVGHAVLPPLASVVAPARDVPERFREVPRGSKRIGPAREKCGRSVGEVWEKCGKSDMAPSRPLWITVPAPSRAGDRGPAPQSPHPPAVSSPSPAVTPSGKCQWINGDVRTRGGKRGAYTFCHAPVTKHGGSWCKAHEARVWASRRTGPADGRVFVAGERS